MDELGRTGKFIYLFSKRRHLVFYSRKNIDFPLIAKLGAYFIPGKDRSIVSPCKG